MNDVKVVISGIKACLQCGELVRLQYINDAPPVVIQAEPDDIPINPIYELHKPYCVPIREENDTMDRNHLEELLIHWEVYGVSLSKCLTVAHDGDKLVVGIGHDVLPQDNLTLGNRITLEQLHVFFRHDVDTAIAGAKRLIADFESHPERVQVVLAAMVFQMGEKGTSAFKKMLAAIEQRDYDKASEEMLRSKWATQTRRRAIAMANRMRSSDSLSIYEAHELMPDIYK